MKKRLFAIILPIVVILAIGGTALASWTANLNSTGNITVGAQQDFTLDSYTLAWGDNSYGVNETINIVATALTATNNGSDNITGFTVNLDSSPAEVTDWQLSVNAKVGGVDIGPGNPLTSGGTAVLTFTLTGTAPSTYATIDLTKIQATLTATGTP